MPPIYQRKKRTVHFLKSEANFVTVQKFKISSMNYKFSTPNLQFNGTRRGGGGTFHQGKIGTEKFVQLMHNGTKPFPNFKLLNVRALSLRWGGNNMQ